MNDAQARNLIQRLAVGDILRRSAGRLPDKIAVVERRGNQDLHLTYRELNRQANRLALALRGLGLKKGDRVATICANSTEFVIIQFGVAKGGYVLVPLNPMSGTRDVAYVIRHAEAEVLIIDDVLTASVAGIRESLPTVRQIITLSVSGRGPVAPFTPFDELLNGRSSLEVEDVVIWDRDPFQIMYTSGTTAISKGVVISHLAVFLASISELIEMGTGRESIVSIVLPMFHAGQQCQVFSTLLAGGRIVIMRGFDAGALLATIQREMVTKILLLPMMYRALLDHPDLGRYDLSSLRTCVYGMAPMDRRTLEEGMRKFKAGFYMGTGQTEAYPASNILRPEWQLLKEGNYWGTSTIIYDTGVMDDQGRLLPPEHVGEIVWRSPAVMEGYYKDAPATEESRKFGWHHSGDLGFFDNDGLLVFVDRKKDMVKSGGENVSSVKVERIILADPRVEAAAVLGLPHQKWHEAVTAFVVRKKGLSLSADDIMQTCRRELGGFEVPKAIIFVDELPRTVTGKVQKHLMRDRYRNYYQDA
jgi:long-chain acyl-CoA synthetase